MNENKDYYDPSINAYRLPGALIHSTKDGRNIAIRNNKVIGEDASLILPEVSIKAPRSKLILKSDNTQINKSPILVSNNPTPLNLTRLNSTKYGKILSDKIRLENPTYYDYKVRLEALQNNPKSEVVRYTDHTGKLRLETRVLGLSGTDPLGELYIEGIALNPIAKGLGKLTKLGLNRISPLKILKSILPATRSTSYYPKPTKEYIPNTLNIFLYNAFLDSHFYDKPVKDIIKTFLKNRNINYLESFIPTLTDALLELLRNFIRTYKFQASKIPYYTSSKLLLKDHPIIKQNLKDLSKIELDELLDVDNALIDVGDDYAILAKDPTLRIHEAEHVLLRRRYNSETRGAYLPLLELLLSRAYIHSKNGIPDAALINEKGAVNLQLRTLILDSFKDNFGRYPSLKELNKYIDEFSDKSLLKLLKNKTNSYGLEYSKNKLNPKTIKEALKYIGATTLILKNNNYEKD